ncbi:hypothetical protein [Pyruvatibacter sp.]|uniref:hypothetical protein n=1 Tax=Pyruvatibacter sp. TaxID=1981328 RepID=UPI0032EFE1D8
MSSGPDRIFAADWSVNARGRWMCRVERDGDRFHLHAPEPVGDPETLVERVAAGARSTLLGLDLPIGLPRRYAAAAGIASFRAFLDELDAGARPNFFDVTEAPSLDQPFYPPHSRERGRHSRATLAAALGVSHTDDLLRACDRGGGGRRKAECLFFTCGGAQVGRAAGHAWRTVLLPRLDRVRLWPFDGPLRDLASAPGVTIAEIYPAAAYARLGVGMTRGMSKRRREDRRAVCADIRDAMARLRVTPDAAAAAVIDGGFAADHDFDALLGALLLVDAIQSADVEPPPDETIRGVEGWIIGTAHSRGPTS